jgi:hypothetical protein
VGGLTISSPKIPPSPTNTLELDAGSYISGFTYTPEHPKNLQVAQKKHSIWGSNPPRRKLAYCWEVFVPRGGIGCKGSFPASRRVGRVRAYLITGVSSFVMTESNHQISTLGAFNLAAISPALVLLGPGSFSVDTRLFGRREIIIPEGRRSHRR